MKNLFIKFIRSILNVFGVNIIKIRKTFNQTYKDNIGKKPIIFDVGANDGQSIERFSSMFPKSTVHSFEPIKECYEKIFNIYNRKNIIINNFALGDKDCERIFHVNKNSYTSSFFKINKKYAELVNYDQINKSEKKKIKTLDGYVNLHKIKKIDILKIDTQGYELNVLKGGKKSLKDKIKFIELELTLADYYKKKINFYEIDKVLSKNNFILCNMDNFSYNKNKQLAWFDLLYLKKNF
jgi:FkbM family methyltransferase